MSRGVGLAEWLAGAPDAVTVLAAILTQLADLWFLVGVAGLLYWLGPHTPRIGAAIERDRALLVLGAVVLAAALTQTAKVAVALPRPPWFVADPTLPGLSGPLATAYAWLAGADGFGFPSGHAVAATLGWGALAWAVRVGSVRRRAAVAGSVVTVVATCRLVLGLHFLVDVVAGVALGLAALAVLYRGRAWPGLGLALAVPVALAGVAIAGLGTDLAATLGLALGGAAVWLATDAQSAAIADTRAAWLTAAVGVGAVLPAAAVAVRGPLSPVGTLALATVAGAAAVALPLVGERVEERRAI